MDQSKCTPTPSLTGLGSPSDQNNNLHPIDQGALESNTVASMKETTQCLPRDEDPITALLEAAGPTATEAGVLHPPREDTKLQVETTQVNNAAVAVPSVPETPVQYIDERTKRLGRMAELEELRKRNDLMKKKAAFNSDSPSSTSLASFFLQQKQMKHQVRMNRQGALSSLSEYRFKDSDGKLTTTPRTPKRDSNSFGSPSAYSTMADIDFFFRKQKQTDLEWREKKENTLKKLHMYRQAHVLSNKQSDEAAQAEDSNDDAGVDQEGANNNQVATGADPTNDNEVFSSLLMVHAELVQFFSATMPESQLDDEHATRRRLSLENKQCEPVLEAPNTPIRVSSEAGNDCTNKNAVDKSSPTSTTVERPDTSITPASVDKLENNSPAEDAAIEGIQLIDESCSYEIVDGALEEENDPVDEMPTTEQNENMEGPINDVDQPTTSATEAEIPEDEAKDDNIDEQPESSSSETMNVVKPICAAEADDDAGEEKKENESFEVGLGQGLELLDPFSEAPRPTSFDCSEKQYGSSASDKKSCPLGLCEESFHSLDQEFRLASSVPASSPMPTVDSSVSSIGSSIEEGSIGNGRLSRTTSASSDLSSFWNQDFSKEDYNEALMCRAEQYLPNLHSSKGPCERCLSLASQEERAKFRAEGRHLHIMLCRGGCRRSCTAFPRGNHEPPVRLCRKCYFDTHRAGGSPVKA